MSDVIDQLEESLGTLLDDDASKLEKLVALENSKQVVTDAVDEKIEKWSDDE